MSDYTTELRAIRTLLTTIREAALNKRGTTTRAWTVATRNGMPEQDGTINAQSNTIDWLDDEIATAEEIEASDQS